ncbi:remorin family protein [Actinidia rufa]|uniref:Remorin family protein n=1 Tax=Actinidia rufa TaxID=165716 RepID=A0A7J0E0J9_9ERIC|nr:remorin family protein [Actinidia rufa]
MAELGLEDRNQQISRFRARDFSPDSVIFTAESNFSLFSSASASHLAGRDQRETLGGPDLDPNKSTGHINSCHRRKVEKAKVQKAENDAEIENKDETLDSARNSFSQALKECQERRSRSEYILKKSDRRRPASLDLNNHTTNATNASPRFGVMKKGSGLTRQTGTFPSPGTPNYQHTSIGAQKGWSSERVPLHTNGNRKQVNPALLPFNNGRTLPSKWEDAERWIFSPVSGDGPVRPSLQQPQRRPKSKSGPLGTAWAAVLGADGLSIRSGAGSGAGIYPACLEPCMARSVSIHGCSELVSHSSLPGPQDGKIDENKDAATNISRDVSRRDMATQMSPEGSPHSSPRQRPSFSPSTSSVLSIIQSENVQSSKLEVRDVQVDERVTMTRWSKKHRVRFSGKGLENTDEWKKKDLETESSSWEVSEAAKSISKMKREEAKVTAWENLQIAKAEAAIRKLEMKLEKKRSSSMDRIMKKLRSAQKKAQEMRSSVLTNQSHQVASTSNKVISFRQTSHISSLRSCFTCHAC